MEAPQINSIPCIYPRFSSIKKITLSMAALAALLTTGCVPPERHASGIYGIYEGASADYSRGGAAAPVVDNGFSVDGMGTTVSKNQSKPTQVNRNDTLSGSGKDTLEGKGTDTLVGSDNSPMKTSSDTLDTGRDALDPDNRVEKYGVDGQNFYSYWIRGRAVNATITVKINSSDIPVLGPIDEEVSDLVHPGMNRVDIKYTPIDSTSSALISVRKGANDVGDSVHFDSNMYALTNDTTSVYGSASNTPKVISKTYYFFAN